MLGCRVPREIARLVLGYDGDSHMDDVWRRRLSSIVDDLPIWLSAENVVDFTSPRWFRRRSSETLEVSSPLDLGEWLRVHAAHRYVCEVSVPPHIQIHTPRGRYPDDVWGSPGGSHGIVLGRHSDRTVVYGAFHRYVSGGEARVIFGVLGFLSLHSADGRPFCMEVSEHLPPAPFGGNCRGRLKLAYTVRMAREAREAYAACGLAGEWARQEEMYPR